MKNQKGLVGLPVLIWIVLGLIVVGGGAYYVMHQTPSQPVSENNLDNSQTLPTNTTNPVSPQNSQTTQGTTNMQSSATIDQSSLTTDSSTLLHLTGTVSGTASISVEVGGSWGLSTDRGGGIIISNGHWSTRTSYDPADSPFAPGTYPVYVTDNKSGKLLTSATLTVKASSNTSTPTLPVSSAAPSVKVVHIFPTRVEVIWENLPYGTLAIVSNNVEYSQSCLYADKGVIGNLGHDAGSQSEPVSIDVKGPVSTGGYVVRACLFDPPNKITESKEFHFPQ